MHHEVSPRNCTCHDVTPPSATKLYHGAVGSIRMTSSYALNSIKLGVSEVKCSVVRTSATIIFQALDRRERHWSSDDMSPSVIDNKSPPNDA